MHNVFLKCDAFAIQGKPCPAAYLGMTGSLTLVVMHGTHRRPTHGQPTMRRALRCLSSREMMWVTRDASCPIGESQRVSLQYRENYTLKPCVQTVGLTNRNKLTYCC